MYTPKPFVFSETTPSLESIFRNSKLNCNAPEFVPRTKLEPDQDTVSISTPAEPSVFDQPLSKYSWDDPPEHSDLDTPFPVFSEDVQFSKDLNKNAPAHHCQAPPHFAPTPLISSVPELSFLSPFPTQISTNELSNMSQLALSSTHIHYPQFANMNELHLDNFSTKDEMNQDDYANIEEFYQNGCNIDEFEFDIQREMNDNNYNLMEAFDQFQEQVENITYDTYIPEIHDYSTPKVEPSSSTSTSTSTSTSISPSSNPSTLFSYQPKSFVFRNF